MVSADVSVVSVKDAVEEAVRTNGHVDVLVNNAGMMHFSLLQDIPPEKYEVCSVRMRRRAHSCNDNIPSWINIC